MDVYVRWGGSAVPLSS